MPYVAPEMTVFEAIHVLKQITASTNTGPVSGQVATPKQGTADAQGAELVGKLGPSITEYNAEEAARLIQEY